MSTTNTKTRTPDLLDLLGEDRVADYQEQAPRGTWLGWKVVRPDFRTTDGFRWPFPGNWAYSLDTITTKKQMDKVEFNTNSECPTFPGDGLCVAGTWAGASSGGIPAAVGLILAYHPADLLSDFRNKKRVKRAKVIDVIDIPALVITNGNHANLRYANLRSANLRYADLGSADLGSANLGYANLRYANLRYANLRYADLRSANLRYANLRYADLGSADLGYARANRFTVWPDGFKVPASVVIDPV